MNAKERREEGVSSRWGQQALLAPSVLIER